MSYTKLRDTLAEVLGTAYQVPEEDIAELIPEEESAFAEGEFKLKFLELDKNRITTINQKGKDKFEQGYSKAKKEERENFEKEIKEEFGIDDEELIGLDLVKKVAEKSSKNGKANIKDLSEDELKTHPSVIKLLSDKDKTFKEQEAKLKGEYDQKLAAYDREKLVGRVSQKAIALIKALNPVLSEDPVKAQNQLGIALRDIESHDYQEEGDSFIPLKDGKRLENAHGHGVDFNTFIKGIAEKYYDFKQSDPRNTPPADGGGAGGGIANFPKNEAEYAKMITDTSIPVEDRKKIQAEWNKKDA